jgi:hypothetical protein
MAVKLTEYKINSIKSKPNPFKIWDSIGRGLYLLVYPSGNKSWYVKYRINKKEKRINLGSFPFPEEEQRVIADNTDDITAIVETVKKAQDIY